MVDISQDSTNASRPRRRRRAASRPAGPPIEEVEGANAAPDEQDESSPSDATPGPEVTEDVTPETTEPETTEPAEPETTEPVRAARVLLNPFAPPVVIESAVEDAGADARETEQVGAEQAEPEPSGDEDEATATETRQKAGGNTSRNRRSAKKSVDSEVPEVGDTSPTGAPADSEAEDSPAADSDADDSDADDSDADDSDADDSVAVAPDDNSDDNDDDDRPRRRRRRRGGRRRRRGSDAEDDQDSSDEDSDPKVSADANGQPDASVQPDAKDSGEPESDADSVAATGGDEAATDADEATSEDASSADEESSSSNRRRRRRRRRRGEDTSGADDDPSDVVVKVREGRRNRGGSDEVTGIDGSTRMEAKRQRRREGRSAGRRRAPILSEAEFLARRESVERSMVIRQNDDLTQIGVLEDGVLVEHYVDRASAASLIGNIYLGRVQNVLPSMEAAFIDIGRGRNAVLYAGEVDWDTFGVEGEDRKVENVLKSGQTVVVQVTKDPVGAKGARLTGHISLPGRYIVYAPGGHLSGISRKLPDTERKRLKEILSDLISDKASVIVRTAAEGATEDELVRDVTRLKAQWESIDKQTNGGGAPKLLYGEPDLTVRIVRDLFTEDFSGLQIDGNGQANDAYDTVTAYVGHVAPHLVDRITRWDRDKGDLFAAKRIDEQISKALERKVFLPSGGSLIIDRTEAMTVIDVNTGKFTGSGGNLEATVTSNNLEAAEEVVRQLRLRDIGGIIVIDFIDMVLPSNRDLLLRRLVECLSRDRTRHQVAEVTSLGLVQMTRKKIGTGLAEAFTEPCDCCGGRGYEIHDMPVESQAPSDGGERRGGKNARRGGKNANKGAKGKNKRNGSDVDGTEADEAENSNGDHVPMPNPASRIKAAAEAKTRRDAEAAENSSEVPVEPDVAEFARRLEESARATEGERSGSSAMSATRSQRADLPERPVAADAEVPAAGEVSDPES